MCAHVKSQKKKVNTVPLLSEKVIKVITATLHLSISTDSKKRNWRRPQKHLEKLFVSIQNPLGAAVKMKGKIPDVIELTI